MGEDKEAARTALQWALHNLFRHGDVIVLLHVFSPPPRKKKFTAARLLRRHGYHLALSFRELCGDFFNSDLKIFLILDENLISSLRDRGLQTKYRDNRERRRRRWKNDR
ncbi:hypothetical protein HID58_093328 [Brassica napus]|uniref:UspA domain-containing protein n=1 Tax=Brassica napus TaxID=3708 RepID=A0ABQ7XE60_BRANA|nr:hypothetical protein HID58_093328 [Brassica napus]